MRQILTIIFLLCACPAWATNRYISTAGTATWANSINTGTPCSLATANTYADDDDVVILADGDYTTAICPAKAGSIGHPITYQAANKWGAIIKNPAAIWAGRNTAIVLRVNWVIVDGIKVDGSTFTLGGPNALFESTWSASYIEIKNCWFLGDSSHYAGNVRMNSGTHQWFHDNLVEHNCRFAPDCDDSTYGMQVGYDRTPKSQFATIENNIFRYGGHHNIETFTRYNVIRNNFLHNEGSEANPGGCVKGTDSNDLYGNRNIQIYDWDNVDGIFALLEGNRFGPSGPSADDDGGDGMTITAPKNIIRYNEVYSAQNNGIMMKVGYLAYSKNNRIYNNTITGSGRYQNCTPRGSGCWQGANLRWYYSDGTSSGNVIKNNIFWAYGTNGGDWYGEGVNSTANSISYNLCTNEKTGDCLTYGQDPLFTDGTLPSIDSEPVTTDPDLTLQAESPAIDAGTYLTQAAGAGTDSVTLTVDDALYFQDGTWGSSLSDVQADWIAIGTVTNVAQIESIDYPTNVITLTVPMTWADNANIWLYRDSDGTRVLSGAAPDQGAHESNAPDTVVSGTLVGDLGLTEDEVVAGGQEVDLTLSGTTWVADVVSDASKKAALIAGITGNSADTHGWNNEVVITSVTRISDTVVRVVIPASSGYDIESPEVVSAQIAAALTASNEVINATPNITIDIMTPMPPSGSAKASVGRGGSSAKSGALGTSSAKSIQ